MDPAEECRVAHVLKIREKYLKDLPFVNDPFVVKEEGKGLSECDYDKRAHDIIENLKRFEDNNTGEV